MGSTMVIGCTHVFCVPLLQRVRTVVCLKEEEEVGEGEGVEGLYLLWARGQADT